MVLTWQKGQAGKALHSSVLPSAEIMLHLNSQITLKQLRSKSKVVGGCCLVRAERGNVFSLENFKTVIKLTKRHMLLVIPRLINSISGKILPRTTISRPSPSSHINLDMEKDIVSSPFSFFSNQVLVDKRKQSMYCKMKSN